MGAKEDKNGQKRTITVNRKARHEYFIDDTITAGLVLVGTEVKSLRAGKVNLNDSFAKVDKSGEAFVHNMYVTPHAEGGRDNVPPTRPRKLLLKRSELDKLFILAEQKGIALVPLALFFDRGFAKLELGIGRGKKLYDKRDTIAERDRTRDMARAASGRD